MLRDVFERTAELAQDVHLLRRWSDRRLLRKSIACGDNRNYNDTYFSKHLTDQSDLLSWMQQVGEKNAYNC